MEIYSTTVKSHLQTDILVIGGGPAGVIAALAAAEQGAAVTLVERYGFLGGVSTQVMDTFCGFYPPGDNAEKVVGGIPDRVVQELMQRGKALYRMCPYSASKLVTYDRLTLKVIWETMAQQAGVRVLLHTYVVDAWRDSDRVMGVVAVNKGGFARLQAGVIIDASGDADVAAAVGVPFESAEHGPVQTLTTSFRLMKVDVERAQQAGEEELRSLITEAVERNGYDLPGRDAVFWNTPLAGVVSTNMTQITGIDPIDPWQLSEAERQGRGQAMEYMRFLKDYVPGFENAELLDFSTQIGVRESRRIFGDYRLTRDDVVSGQSFEDAIAKGAWPIEKHNTEHDTISWEHLSDNVVYNIPYRSLLPLGVEGLLVAGRCFSADHDAHASARTMAQCMAMGQAAGVAAALASDKSLVPREVSRGELQDNLRELGAVI
jgi:glycine/D-amino acid oxidase-like deaminating enzyme